MSYVDMLHTITRLAREMERDGYGFLKMSPVRIGYVCLDDHSGLYYDFLARVMISKGCDERQPPVIKAFSELDPDTLMLMHFKLESMGGSPPKLPVPFAEARSAIADIQARQQGEVIVK